MPRVRLAAILVALMAVPSFGTAASAAPPTCDGKVATIVGTNGNNTITGTRRADVIVAKGGKDRIDARGGRDRICGGTGDDRILGGRGNDRVFGGSGDDSMKGGAGDDDTFGFNGNDNIFGEAGTNHTDGGDGYDRCFPGNGSGTRCEFAELAVDVQSPAETSEEAITFRVDVENQGPDDIPYSLFIELDSPGLDCGDYPFEGFNDEPVLSARDLRSKDYQVFCDNPHGAEPHVTMEVTVFGFGWDSDPSDNSDESSTFALLE